MSTLKIPVNGNDHYHGNVNATHTFVEYGDFQCPSCRRAYPLVKRLRNENSNDLKIVFRHFPIRSIHPMAFSAAVSAEAAGMQGKFWEMHDLIFENQEKISAHFIMLLAESIGINVLQFEKDSQKDRLRKKIESDFQSGVISGVNATPSFFINNNLLEDYDETYESLIGAFSRRSQKKKSFRHY